MSGQRGRKVEMGEGTEEGGERGGRDGEGKGRGGGGEETMLLPYQTTRYFIRPLQEIPSHWLRGVK